MEAGAVARPSVTQLSAGVQDIVISERGGRRRDFHDLGVLTRQEMAHVKDSKTGATGTPQMLITNHIKLVSRPQWVLYQYHIDFKPPMEARRLRTALLYQHEELLGLARAFDGAILFLPRRLNKVTEVVSQTRNKESVKITITLTNELPPTSPTCFQFYNIIFKRILKILNMTQIGRNYYNPKDAILISAHSLNIWPGFTASILQYESSIMLNIDVSHKVLRNETVYDMLASYFARHGPKAGKDVLAKETLGQIVLTQYNNRTYRVDEIFWNMNPQSTFKKYDGTDISFVEYYKTQYGIQIKDLQQPLIANIPKKVKPGEKAGPLLLIPELCHLTGLTDKMRSDFTVMKDLAVYTRLDPSQRVNVVDKFLNRINRDVIVQKELRDWGLSFDSKLLMFQGRTLPAEKIVTTGGSYSYEPGFAEWTRAMKSYSLVTAINLNSWLLLFTRRNYDEANQLLQHLFKVSGQLGIYLNNANMLEIEDSQAAYMHALRQHVTNTTQMVVCVLSGAQKAKYDSIKRFLCVDRPTPSQCVLAKTLSRPNTILAVALKIALQMNCKMGGALWSLEIPLPEAMVVGIDCYHDTLAGRKSIAAFVASMNKGLTSWFSRCVVQDQRQEIVDGLLVCMLAALQAYRSYQQVLPKKILIYRDGVGDGQLKTIVNYEIKQFTDCIRSVEPNYNPKLVVVVVKKRINARFFGCGSGRLYNPLPGTIIDTEVTRPEWYDFFLISQSVRQGTVSPTHYNVIYDTLGMPPDYLQRFTYKLCHLYYNWSIEFHLLLWCCSMMVNSTDVQANVSRPLSLLENLNIEVMWITILTPTLVCYFCFVYIIAVILSVYLSSPHIQDNGRYVLFAHMLINDSVYLSIGVFLMIVSIYKVYFPVTICYLLVMVTSTSFKVTPYNLAVMSLERYVAICFPLRHAEICTRQKSGVAIALIWVMGLIPNIVDFIILASSAKFGFFSQYVLCSRASFLNTAVQNVLRSLVHALTFSLVGLIILFTYIKIMVVATKIHSGKGSASKASKTVILHAFQLLLCMTAFTYPITEKYLMQYSLLIPAINFCLFMFMPRFLSPIIYGIRDDAFRACIARYVFCKPVRVDSNLLNG
uniref:Piwi-like protein 1 n=1 Tax=Leptobrachium leishanense TaxID=445787 RepID=A0A8C5LYC6_9ANUR